MIICRICFSRIFAKLHIEDSRLDSWVFLVFITSVGFRFWQHFNYKLKMTIWSSLLTRFGINCSSEQTSGYLLSPSFKSVWHRAQNPLHCAGDNAHRFVSALSHVPESSTVGLFPGCWPSCGPLPSTWTGFVAHGCAAFPPAQPVWADTAVDPQGHRLWGAAWNSLPAFPGLAGAPDGSSLLQAHFHLALQSQESLGGSWAISPLSKGLPRLQNSWQLVQRAFLTAVPTHFLQNIIYRSHGGKNTKVAVIPHNFSASFSLLC